MVYGIKESKDRILGTVDQIETTEILSVDESLGRVLAEPVIAKNEYPKQDVSRFDGYALKVTDLEKGDKFRITDSDFLEEDQCKRVETGKGIPRNTNLVVKVEDVVKEDGFITIERTPNGKNIFQKGSNVKKGRVLLEPETRINEVRIGTFPTIEMESVEVYEKLKVGIMATGDEITSLNDVNSRILNGLIEKNGGELTSLKRVQDVEKNIRDTIVDMVNSDLDFILTIGGTSKGEKDYVVKAISDIGNIKFKGVKMRPGKTFTFGDMNNKPIFSLSGTVTPFLLQSYLYLRPALRFADHLPEIAMEKFQSNKNISANSHKLLSKGAYKAFPAKTRGGDKIEPIFGKYSTVLPFFRADCIMIIDEDKDEIKKGEEIKALPLY